MRGRIHAALLVGACVACLGASPKDVPAPSDQARLVFRANPEKREYQPGEVIKFMFSLQNAGRSDVLVSRHFYLEDYVYLTITGPDGKELPWCGVIDGRLEEFAILRPGATIRSHVRVSCDAGRYSGFEFNRPGKYVVSAYYYMSEPSKELKRIAQGATVTKEKIPARPVTIIIRAPNR